MKKTQFISPIILIFILISYFIIITNINNIHSTILKTQSNLIILTNEIKNIEQLDLEYQSTLFNKVLFNLTQNQEYINAEEKLEEINNKLDEITQIFRLKDNHNQIDVIGINYTKEYTIENNKTIIKTISGTLKVPFPYFEFNNLERTFRDCYNNLNNKEDINPCLNEINQNSKINAQRMYEGINEIIIISHLDFLLSNKDIYPYTIILNSED